MQILDELMMEGDLLEVSLDETDSIWRILSQTSEATKSIRKWPPLDQGSPALNDKESKKGAQSRGRKRKSEELETPKNKKKIEEKPALPKGRRPMNKELKQTPPSGQLKRGPRKVAF